MATYEIELNNTYANQEFDIIIDGLGRNIHILLQTFQGISLLSVYVNNKQVGIPFICFPNQPIIPFPYMVEIVGGNFIFETQNDNYPNYENFGKTCKLYFLTMDELNNAQ